MTTKTYWRDRMLNQMSENRAANDRKAVEAMLADHRCDTCGAPGNVKLDGYWYCSPCWEKM